MAESSRLLVVTPTLGQSEYLDATVASVLAQPLDLLHVLSAPAAKVPALRARFPHARVVPDGGRKGGVYGAINAALAQSGGDWSWFTYINDDDALGASFAPVFAEHSRRRAPEPVIYGNVAAIDWKGRPIALITIEKNPAWIPALLQQGISPIMQQGMVFRREVVLRLGGFDLRYRLCADLDFWLRAYVAGARFRCYSKCVAFFRIHAGQLSGQTAITIREQDEIVARHLPVPPPRVRLRVARLRYRTCNLPRYLARARSKGFLTSYQLLRQAGEETRA